MNVFSVIKFPNDFCTGNNGLNGTCYTQEECTAKGGQAAGTCASGFGVCCTFSLSCGSMSSENNTYFDQITFTTWNTNSGNSPCTYRVCPMENVCRIRLDLSTFVLKGPNGISSMAADADGSIGKCNLESMSITSPGMKPPPIICGTNSGQHMFLDVTDECVDINIHIDTFDTTTSRTWAIHVKQYTCGDTNAGPTGCLQYHTGTAGSFATFNFDLAATAASSFASITHLANQDYNICFRREENYCRTCFWPKIAYSFGLTTETTAGMARAGPDCYTPDIADYIEIPGAQEGSVSTATSEFTTKDGATLGSSRMCGQLFSNIDATGAAAVTICSKYLSGFFGGSPYSTLLFILLLHM